MFKRVHVFGQIGICGAVKAGVELFAHSRQGRLARHGRFGLCVPLRSPGFPTLGAPETDIMHQRVEPLFSHVRIGLQIARGRKPRAGVKALPRTRLKIVVERIAHRPDFRCKVLLGEDLDNPTRDFALFRINAISLGRTTAVP